MSERDASISQLPDLACTAVPDPFNLSQWCGQWVVLYFYPKDATSGCTTQAQEFSALYDQFQALNAQIIGVSRDSVGSHQRFIEKQNIPFPLISDGDEVVCRLYDVIQPKNMYGKMVQGIVRSTFLYNPAGELMQTWHKVKAAGHAAAVLAEIERLSLSNA